MAKGADAFRSIGEVAKLLGVAPHVLRYWETQFSQLKPMKRGDGRRYYRPDDVKLAAGICEILRDDGLTIRGAKKMLAKDRGESVRERGAEKLANALADLSAQAEKKTSAPGRIRKKKPDPEPMPLFEEPETPAAAAAPEESPPAAAKEPAPSEARAPLPDPAPVDAAQAAWLGKLAAAALVLQAQQDAAALSAASRDAANRLLDAIADHY